MGIDVFARCKVARKEAGLTQKEAADALKISERSLRDREKFSRVTTQEYELMAALYGCTSAWLITGEGAMYGQDDGSMELDIDAEPELTFPLNTKNHHAELQHYIDRLLSPTSE